MLLHLPRTEPISQEKDKWCHGVTSWRHTMTSWRHTMTSHYIIMSQHRPAFCILALKPENLRHHVFDLVTLTFDLWPLPIELVQDFIKVNPCAKFRDRTSIRSVMRVFTNSHTHTHTHRQTDGSVFITSTADAGGKKYVLEIMRR